MFIENYKKFQIIINNNAENVILLDSLKSKNSNWTPHFLADQALCKLQLASEQISFPQVMSPNHFLPKKKEGNTFQGYAEFWVNRFSWSCCSQTSFGVSPSSPPIDELITKNERPAALKQSKDQTCKRPPGQLKCMCVCVCVVSCVPCLLLVYAKNHTHRPHIDFVWCLGWAPRIYGYAKWIVLAFRTLGHPESSKNKGIHTSSLFPFVYSFPCLHYGDASRILNI